VAHLEDLGVECAFGGLSRPDKSYVVVGGGACIDKEVSIEEAPRHNSSIGDKGCGAVSL